MMRYNKSLYRLVKDINDSIPTDFLGGSGFSKCYIMACLAQLLDLRHFVEIGIYRGKSLFSVAVPFVLSGGTAIGIDPYIQEAAFEEEPLDAAKDVNDYIEKANFEAIYKEVLDRKSKLGFGDSLQVIRELSSNAVLELEARNHRIDMLHIDGNHDTKFVQQDYNNYYPLLTDGAIIVFDDINWPSVNIVYQKSKTENVFVLEAPNYGILIKGDRTPANEKKARELSIQLSSLYKKLEALDERPTVSVGVLAYNHADFISDCLDNVFNQQGFFELKVFICDDCSEDKTVEIVEKAISCIDPFSLIDVEFFQNSSNIGMVQNFKQLVNMLGNGDFFTFCEGDDYWCDVYRIATHIDFLTRNKDLSFSFNANKILLQDTGEFFDNESHEILLSGPFDTFDITMNNFIQNLGVGFYRSKHLGDLDPEMFERTYCGDWMFNIAFSRFGKFGYIKKAMNVYRKHDGGIWSSMDLSHATQNTLGYVDEYNSFTEYAYDYGFQKVKNLLLTILQQNCPNCDCNSQDVIVFDDFNPILFGEQNLIEYKSILDNFDNSRLILSSQQKIENLNHHINVHLQNWKRSNPHLAHKVWIVTPNAQEILQNCNAKLLYSASFDGLCMILDSIEKARIPFVVKLVINDIDSFIEGTANTLICKVKKVLSSDCLRGVIVTQSEIYDSLIQSNMCNRSLIYLISGFISPSRINGVELNKAYFPEDKNSIDICTIFNADVQLENNIYLNLFLTFAKQLCLMHENLRFHVLGCIAEYNIDNEELHGGLSYHCVESTAHFKELLAKMDIMLSLDSYNIFHAPPIGDIPDSVFIDLAYSKVAMFCTSTHSVHQNHFVNGHDIVILNNDVDLTIACIDYYVSRPKQLKLLQEHGYLRAKKIFGTGSEDRPCVEMLKGILYPGHLSKNSELQFSEQKSIIPIMHCFDNNYVIPAAVSFYSMLQHASTRYEYKLYVLHCDITSQNQKKLTQLVGNFPNATIEFIDMTNRFNYDWMYNSVRGKFYTKELLYKLVAPSIFPMYDKLIITDVDVVFEGDISPSFFSFDVNDSIYVAGTRHIHPPCTLLDEYYSSYTYRFGDKSLSSLKICAGYMVLNLHQLRADKMEDMFINYLKANGSKLIQPEQDVFNFCLKKENITLLPLNYVLCTYAYDIFETEDTYDDDPHYKQSEIADALLNPIQIHYAGREKPWKFPNITKAGKWFSTLKQTSFYEDYIAINQVSNSNPLLPCDVLDNYCDPTYPVVVSILCCTYNHTVFIEKTLSYIVNQKTNYTFEVIVSDDASTDGTQQIIQKYMDEYPDLFKKCILRKENVGIGQNYYEALQLVEGKYLAICDGDDYWISPNKLQWQVDFLEKNEEFSICCSSFMQKDTDSKKQAELFDVNAYIKAAWTVDDNSSYSLNDLLYCRFIASCTVMMRWQLHGRIPDFIKHSFVIDFPLALIHSAFGRIFVINEPALAQYNVRKEGVFKEKIQLMAIETRKIILEVNQFLKFRYNSQVEHYLDLTNVTPSVSANRRDKLKWFYIYWIPPFMQKMYIRSKAKKQASDDVYRPPSIFKRFVLSTYRECIPEAIKQFYRKKIKAKKQANFDIR